VTLVEAYEERRWPFNSRRRFDPVDVLHYAIDELGHTQAELAKIVGSRSRASEILSRRRPLALEMIQKITMRWKIPADLLVQRYRSATERPKTFCGNWACHRHCRRHRKFLAFARIVIREERHD